MAIGMDDHDHLDGHRTHLTDVGEQKSGGKTSASIRDKNTQNRRSFNDEAFLET